MARRLIKKDLTKDLLAIAGERIILPTNISWVEYEADADLLYIALKEKPQSTHSDDDAENGIIFDYEGNELVAIEILNLYGVFVS